MAENGAEIDTVLQEWAPMSDLLNKIPTKIQIGLFSHDVSLTCIDILPDFIALGSNLGVVYWYDRKKKDLQRLRCENQNSKITCVKVISTVDYMVACGNCEGQINIFQIPKQHPDSLPENIKPKSKQVERYTVTDLHYSAITSLEWSKNGMKLFSGDKNGLVVLTEIDFYMHLSKSVDILNEAYEVVQLSYCQQQLLVSTTFRTIICQKYDKWKVCQVGKKDRKSLGNYGGIFFKNGLKPTDILIYSTRPGLRIWISDLNGIVQQTLLFKDLLNQVCFEVPLKNPITTNAKKLRPQKEANFGILIPFSDNLLVTYNSDVIYVLDPANLLVIATISHLRRILSVSAFKDELFVLEGERSIVRISFRPEIIFGETSNSIPTASAFLPLTNSIKDLTNKLQNSTIISAIPPLFEGQDYNVQTDITSIIKAEEAIENSPLRKNDQKIQNKTLNVNIDNDVIECLDVRKESLKKYETKVELKDYDDPILFKHRRKKKYKLTKNDLTKSVTSLSSTSSEEKDSQINRPCMLNVSTIGTIFPDLRSPDSILNDIETKEKLLADMLNLDKIKFALENPQKINKNESVDISEHNNFKENHIPSNKIVKNDIIKPMVQEMSLKKPKFDLNEPVLNYGPPSNSSNTFSIETPACLSIPNVWKLQELTINQDANEASDSSLCDWEIIN